MNPISYAEDTFGILDISMNFLHPMMIFDCLKKMNTVHYKSCIYLSFNDDLRYFKFYRFVSLL